MDWDWSVGYVRVDPKGGTAHQSDMRHTAVINRMEWGHGPWGRAWRRRTPRGAGPACTRASTPPPSSGRSPRGPTACPAGTASCLWLTSMWGQSIDHKTIDSDGVGAALANPNPSPHTHSTPHPISSITIHTRTRAGRLPLLIRSARRRRRPVLPLVVRHDGAAVFFVFVMGDGWVNLATSGKTKASMLRHRMDDGGAIGYHHVGFSASSLSALAASTHTRQRARCSIPNRFDRSIPPATTESHLMDPLPHSPLIQAVATQESASGPRSTSDSARRRRLSRDCGARRT